MVGLRMPAFFLSKIKFNFLLFELSRYYYQDRKLFYDPKSQNYYTYDEKNKSYEFYANLNSTTVNNRTSKRKRLKLTEHQKLTASDIANDLSTDEDDGKDSANEDDGEDEEEKEDKKVEEEEEEGEVASSDDDMYGPEEAQPSKAICNPSEVSAGPTIYGQSIKLPCVRLIVQSSAALDEGSLVMVAYLGAQIGSQAKCDVEIDEESVDPLHARITYDEQEQAYWVRDLQSTHGSYVNDRLLDGTRCRLKHNDRLRFGQTSFLVHLHEQDLTCDDCEPGCVQAMLAKQRQQKSTDSSESVVSAPTPLLSKKQKMDVHRKELRKLQKKYGINTYAENATSFGASDFYSDRAESRRRVKGSDCPYEKNDLTATSTEKPISASNKGFQLLQKAGWKGQRSDLINDSRLIDVKVRDDRKGLGS